MTVVSPHSLILIPSISFYYFTEPARASRTRLNRSSNHKNFSLVPNFKMRVLKVSACDVTLAIRFSQASFVGLRKFHFISICVFWLFSGSRDLLTNMTHCFESNAFYYITIRHRNDLLTCLTSFHLYQMFEVAFLKDEKTLLVSLKKKKSLVLFTRYHETKK